MDERTEGGGEEVPPRGRKVCVAALVGLVCLEHLSIRFQEHGALLKPGPTSQPFPPPRFSPA